MVVRRREPHSDLFTLRVWPEEVDDGHVEWRGKVQHVTSGEVHYFRDWDAMLAFLLGILDSSAPMTTQEEGQQNEANI